MTPADILSISVGFFVFCNYYKGDDILAISLAAILLLGLPANKLFEKIKLPGLLGMLILGIVIGPYGINLLQQNMINASADFRKIALIIILLRAGLGIDKKALKRNGIIAMKMSSIPVIIEGFTIAFISTRFLNFTFIQGGILGFIIAAVSPAVVVPSTLKTNLNWKERLFCIISYTPKATVQAAMGAVPLSIGVESGELILA
ncbi:MAG TPA: cation:proton antiporter, partial [Schnuerera sp.]|nr:cation:proton antiporter [Schnuerera sp.]